MSWYKTGGEGKKESEKKDTESKLKAEARAKERRFWLKGDTSAKVTFLDTPNFFFSEHNLKIGNNFGNYFTCLADFDNCPLCDAGEPVSYVLVATVIDHNSYKGEDGTEYRGQKKLFVAKGKARQHILKQIERRENNLEFCHYEISRGSGSTECSTGEDFEYEKRLNKVSLVKYIKAVWDKEGRKYTDEDVDNYTKPFDYEKIFKPKTVDELRKIVGGEKTVGGSDDIPFDVGNVEEGKEKIEAKENTVTEDTLDIDDLL